MTDDELDDRIIARLTAEIFAKGDDFQMTLRPSSVLQLVGLLQLALRHPDVGEPSREIAGRFLAGARAYFADCPTVLDVIARGGEDM